MRRKSQVPAWWRKKGFDDEYAGLQSPAEGVDSAAGAGAVVA